MFNAHTWSLSTLLPSKMWEVARKTIEMFDRRLEPDIYVVALPPEAGDEASAYPLISGTGVTCDAPMLTADIRTHAQRLENDYWRHPKRHLLHKRGRSSNVAVRSECLRKTIQNVIDTDNKANLGMRVHICGEAAEFDKFDIIPVIELDRIAYDAYLKLKRLPQPHARMRRSFVDALVEILLEAMSAEISSAGQGPLLPNPTESLHLPPSISQNSDDYLRAAGRWFMAMLLGGKSGRPTMHLFEHCEAVSSRPYEGRSAHGRMLLASLDDSRIEYCVRWDRPVSLENYRWVRKLLEMSSDEVALISDATHAYGLGMTCGYRAVYEDVFAIEFRGHHRWSLLHARHELMSIVDGAPQALRRPLDAAQFEACFRVVIPSRPINVDVVWRLVDAAVKQKHGTMLVIHQDAAQEAQRLANQSTLITPQVMTPSILARVSGIDGGILIDPLGHCYAIGVILDGVATKRGDPSRGARYNSALRYVDSISSSKARRSKTARHCLVAVVSADGDVDLVHAAPIPKPT